MRRPRRERAWPLLSTGFQNIVLVDVADCDDPAAYLEHVAALPAVETLAVGGLAFTDEHLRRLHGLTTLRGLVLDSTSVSEQGMAQIRAGVACRQAPPQPAAGICCAGQVWFDGIAAIFIDLAVSARRG